MSLQGFKHLKSVGSNQPPKYTCNNSGNRIKKKNALPWVCAA